MDYIEVSVSVASEAMPKSEKVDIGLKHFVINLSIFLFGKPVKRIALI